MTTYYCPAPSTKETKAAYDNIVQRIQALYNNALSEKEAHEAARNLIGFCKVLLEIHREQNQNLSCGDQLDQI